MEFCQPDHAFDVWVRHELPSSREVLPMQCSPLATDIFNPPEQNISSTRAVSHATVQQRKAGDPRIVIMRNEL